MKTSVAALACAVCVCVLTPSLAAGGVDDAAATRAYLRAYYVYERGIEGDVTAAVNAIRTHAIEIAGECPYVLTYAPRDAAFDELGEEVDATLYLAGAAEMRPAMLGLANAIAHLRWSDRKLTRLVHAEALEEKAFAMLASPNVCADIAGWRETAYATLPAGATRFLARLNAIESLSFVGFTEETREAMIMRLLNRYEGRSARRVVKRTERIEAQIGNRIQAARAVALKKLATALGVPTR